MVVAVHQLGIATTLVTILFMGVGELVPSGRLESCAPTPSPAPSPSGFDERKVDDTIRRPVLSPPDPNDGRPLRRTQND